MELIRNGTQPSTKGPAQYFTGRVRIDPLFSPTAPARTSAARVTFEPGARNHGRTHPLGKKLLVLCGCGYVQSWGQALRIIRPGDVVECLPGEKHWHGAAPGTAMSHIAIQEELNGRAIDWLEPMTNEQYACTPLD
jgi:quercetin dioxygenase-like cupin family protein